MIEELSKIIYDYIKNYKPIDFYFIEKIASIVSDKLGLEDYVKKISISKDVKDELGIYYLSDKKIIIGINSIIDMINELYPSLKLDYEDKRIIIYYYIVRILLHELEHADQVKKIQVQANNLETKIITSSSPLIILIIQPDLLESFNNSGIDVEELSKYIDWKDKLFKDYYDYDPNERLADYYANRVVMTIFENLKMSRIKDYANYKFHRDLLYGYHDVLSPTEYFFDCTSAIDIWTDIARNIPKLDLETRMSLGLEISDEEYLSSRKKVQKLSRELIIT